MTSEGIAAQESGQPGDGQATDGGVNGSPRMGPTRRLPGSSILALAQEGRFIIEGFVPLNESLEFDLGQQYWRERGSQAFIGDSAQVPYAINIEGNLSG